MCAKIIVVFLSLYFRIPFMRVKYELELESQMNHGHKINDEDQTTSLKSSVEVICDYECH